MTLTIIGTAVAFGEAQVVVEVEVEVEAAAAAAAAALVAPDTLSPMGLEVETDRKVGEIEMMKDIMVTTLRHRVNPTGRDHLNDEKVETSDVSVLQVALKIVDQTLVFLVGNFTPCRKAKVLDVH